MVAILLYLSLFVFAWQPAKARFINMITSAIGVIDILGARRLN